MRKKQPVPLSHKFPNADPLALRLLQRLLAFDPKDRPTAEEVCNLIHHLLLCTTYPYASGKLLLALTVFNDS